MDDNRHPTPPARVSLLTRLRRDPSLAIFVILGVLLVTLSVRDLNGRDAAPVEVTLPTVVSALDAGQISAATLDERTQTLTVTVEPDAYVAVHRSVTDEALRERAEQGAAQLSADQLAELREQVPETGFRLVATYPQSYGEVLATRLVEEGLLRETLQLGAAGMTRTQRMTSWFFVGLLLAVVVTALRRRGSGGAGATSTSSRAKPVEIPTTRFSDVAGVDEAVSDLRDVVDYLHAPEIFAAYGARAPKGVLLEGPPGTGKTLLARAVAGEAGVPFFAVAGSDFVEVFVGRGAARVRDLFDKARKAGKALIFIDEIDAIGRARSGADSGGSERESEQTLISLLAEMDGFEGSGVIVMAATNRADTLDAALLRPGRFDRRVVVPNPDRAGRQRILEIHASGKPFGDEVDLRQLAGRTTGMSGAELANLVNEAAVIAARDLSTAERVITARHLEEAYQTVTLGRARTSALVTAHDREVTAWHEAGHAIAALLLEDAPDPVTVDIVPRGPAGGVTWMEGSDDVFLSRRGAIAQLTVALAGRAAEELLLGGDYTSGASGDLASATNLALQMVTRYGMGESLSVVSPDRYAAGGQTAAIDAAVEALLCDARDEARALLADNRERVETLVAWLLEDEHVEGERLRSLRERGA
jgi:cell division protease FtsH